MLTKQLITQNKALASLSEEQVKAIEELSRNDEEKVIAEKTRDFWGGIDKDIKEAFGKEKAGNQKSYDFLKEVLGQAKEASGKFEQAQTDLTEKEKELTTLRKQVETGSGDAALKAQFKTLETQYNDEKARAERLAEQVQQTQTEFTQKLQQLQEETLNAQLEGFMGQALQGITWKPGFDQEAINLVIRSAKQEVLQTGTPEITELDGRKTGIFRDQNGLPISNPANLQKPYTVDELLLNKLKPFIAEARTQGGTGSGGQGGGGSTGLDLSGAKTQTDALRAIRQHLNASEGLAFGTEAFTEAQTKLFIENKVAELPVK